MSENLKNSVEYKKFMSRIRRTGLRFAVSTSLFWGLLGLCVGLCGSVLYFLFDRIFEPVNLELSTILIILTGFAVVPAIIGFIRNRPTSLRTAIKIDKYINNHEKFSSVLLVDGKTPFEEALILEGMLTLKQAKLGGIARRNFRKLVLCFTAFLAASALSYLFLPEIHLLSDTGNSRLESSLNISDAIKVLTKNEREWEQLRKQDDILTESEQLLEEFEDLKNRLKRAEALKNQNYDPEEQKKLLSALSKLKDKIENAKKNLEKLKNDVKDLKSENNEKKLDQNKAQDEFDKFKKNLSEGDFSKASESLENLMEELKKQAENEELRKQLAEQMKDLADKLSESDLKDQLENLADGLEELDLNDLSNQQLKDLQDNLENLGDLGNLADNLELLELLKQQASEAQKDMTGG